MHNLSESNRLYFLTGIDTAMRGGDVEPTVVRSAMSTVERPFGAPGGFVMCVNRRLMSLGIAAVALVLMGSPVVSEAGDCVFVEGPMTMVQNFDFQPLDGAAQLLIDGELYDAAVTYTVLQRKVTEDGSEVGVGEIFFVIEDVGAFSGIFHTVLDMTVHPFPVNSQGKITEGTGAFEDAYGKLVFHGTFTVDWTVPVAIAEVEIRGKLCDLGFDD